MLTARLFILSVAMAVAAVIAGCGSQTQTTTETVARSTATSTAPAPAPATATAAAPTKSTSGPRRSDANGDGIPDAITVKGTTGQTLRLEGDGLGTAGRPKPKSKVEVTLKAVRGPFSGFDIAADKKLIGLDLHIVNVGSVRFKDPLPDGTLTLVGGATGAFTSLIAVGRPNPCEHPSLNLTHGQAKDFCVAFEVPRDARPQAFQYATDSGYGDTGFWRLK